MQPYPSSLLCRSPFVPFSGGCFPYCSFFTSFVPTFSFFIPFSLNWLSICFFFFLVRNCFQLFRLRFPVCTSYTDIHLSLRVASLRFSTHLLQFHFIYWSTVLVFLPPSSFGCYCPLFHTLAFVLSPDPAAGCLPRGSTKLSLFSRPIASFRFVFIYKLNVLLSVFVSFPHSAHTCSFLCFSLAPAVNFLLPGRLTAK